MRSTEELFHLLSIAEKSLQWPQLKAIHQQAIDALVSHAKSLVKIPEPPTVKTDFPPDNPSFVKPLRQEEDDDGETDSE